ncbi:pyruvate, phosphate dikinase [Marssonina coronariae]|uniref:Pyruvate, phosphate dikinase n=1 Tax=Diplocarpon coronariae TaxID=2795749 RepID=A0A218YUF8_9HELO|nr:pyruvate, phosphate dikinase [Marssonina coronariae]
MVALVVSRGVHEPHNAKAPEKRNPMMKVLGMKIGGSSNTSPRSIQKNQLRVLRALICCGYCALLVDLHIDGAGPRPELLVPVVNVKPGGGELTSMSAADWLDWVSA